jgi:hypothetical protein
VHVFSAVIIAAHCLWHATKSDGNLIKSFPGKSQLMVQSSCPKLGPVGLINGIRVANKEEQTFVYFQN